MKKRAQRIAVLVLVLTMVVTLFACDEKDEGDTVSEPVGTEAAVSGVKCTDYDTPLADLRVRQALRLAIDMDTVIEALFYEKAEPAAGLTGAGEWAGYEYDPEEAKALLAKAGWPSDYVLDVVYYYDDQQTEDLLNVIGKLWSDVGVQAQFRKLEGDLVSQLWEEGASWDLAYAGIAAISDFEVYARFASDATNNSFLPGREDLDELLDRAEASADDAERARLYGEVRDIIGEELLAMPLYHHSCFIFTSDKLDTAGAEMGNDQYSYEKNILNWTTTREDRTLYTNGGPVEYFMDPVVNPGQYLYQELVFERLLNADGQLTPTEGMLAEDYEISEDGREITFTLRKGVKWHDGQPLTAGDVKFTYELLMRCPGANALLTEVLSRLEGAEDFLAGEAEECAGITVRGNVVTFRFEETAADALLVFSQWPVLPEHCLKDAEPETLQEHAFWEKPVGSGPYRVAEVRLGEYCLLERWANYRESGTGNIRFIHMTASGENDSKLILSAGLEQIDYAWSKFTDDCVAIEQMAHMTVTEVETGYVRCFFINQFPHGAETEE